MNIKDIAIEKKFLEKIAVNNQYNEIIQDYYSRLMKETKDRKILNKIESIKDCNRIWILDRYDKAKVKDFKKTNLCKDKFCNNCKKVKQASRMSKFIPLIRPYAKDMYQLTLTMPNVKGAALSEAIKSLFKAFTTLIEYLKGKNKIKGIDFSKMEYEGAIRSLEITYKNDSYHPHLHALIVLKGDISEQRHKNVYSIDFKGKRAERLFSDEEILIQKIWYLLINKTRVTKKAIDELKKGYSCQLDKFQESDFIELFKYMTKATDEENQTLSYKQFKTLHKSLYRVRQIQGYGAFYGLKDEDDISLDDINEAYQSLIDELQKEESPIETLQSPTELVEDKEYTLISRKRIYKHLKNLK